MRWFRQMTGQSFVAFLNEYRLNAAAEALQAALSEKEMVFHKDTLMVICWLLT